jgi:flavodoxin I
MAKIGIFFGSSTGNTERVSEKLQEILGTDLGDLLNVDSATEKDIEKYDYLILATSTWGIGDMQDDMEDFLEVLAKADLKNKKIALLGLGDQDTYPDSFVDGIGTIYQKLKDKATFVGKWPNKDYKFTDSDAVIDDKFVGLVIDQDNQAEKTEDRLKKWATQVKKEFGIK